MKKNFNFIMSDQKDAAGMRMPNFQNNARTKTDTCQQNDENFRPLSPITFDGFQTFNDPDYFVASTISPHPENLVDLQQSFEEPRHFNFEIGSPFDPDLLDVFNAHSFNNENEETFNFNVPRNQEGICKDQAGLSDTKNNQILITNKPNICDCTKFSESDEISKSSFMQEIIFGEPEKEYFKSLGFELLSLGKQILNINNSKKAHSSKDQCLCQNVTKDIDECSNSGVSKPSCVINPPKFG